MMIRCAALCLMAVAVTSPSLAGDLNPPAGPVLPTMKNLSDVEPRIAINAANTPGDANSVFKITQPGSYYLASNVNGPSGFHGIEIAANGVTVDLMGFTLDGASGSLHGISDATGLGPIVIRNGTIINWDGDGIHFGNIQGFLIENIALKNIGGDGIEVAFTGVIRNCSINICTQSAIEVNCCVLIQGCQFGNTDAVAVLASQNVTVVDCAFNNCNGGGVLADSDSVITRCSITFGGGVGIQVGTQCRVYDNFVKAAATGILATSFNNRIEANHVLTSTTGISVTGTGNLIVRNFASQNGAEYSVVAGNLMGPIVTTANILSNNSPHANYRH